MGLPWASRWSASRISACRTSAQSARRVRSASRVDTLWLLTVVRSGVLHLGSMWCCRPAGTDADPSGDIREINSPSAHANGPGLGVRGRPKPLCGEEAPGQSRDVRCPRQNSNLRHPLQESWWGCGGWFRTVLQCPEPPGQNRCAVKVNPPQDGSCRTIRSRIASRIAHAQRNADQNVHPSWCWCVFQGQWQIRAPIGPACTREFAGNWTCHYAPVFAARTTWASSPTTTVFRGIMIGSWGRVSGSQARVPSVLAFSATANQLGETLE